MFPTACKYSFIDCTQLMAELNLRGCFKRLQMSGGKRALKTVNVCLNWTHVVNMTMANFSRRTSH